jgi:hypothetical protein
MNLGYAIESKSWKSQNGSAIQQHPEVAVFYTEQAKIMRKLDHLAIFTLSVDGVPIAWEYGWLKSKRYYSLKIGYDEAYSHLAPGQSLLMQIMKYGKRTRKFDTIDGVGSNSEAFLRWCNRTQSKSRIYIPLNKIGSTKVFVRDKIKSRFSKMKVL